MASETPIVDSKFNSDVSSAVDFGPKKRVSSRQLLAFIAGNAIGINLLLVLAGFLLFHTLKQPSALRAVAASVLFHQADDSLKPMLAAVHSLVNSPQTPVYQSIFFDQHIKFIYPLASLLPVWALDRMGASPRQILWVSRGVCWLSIILTIFLCVKIATRLWQGHGRGGGERNNLKYVVMAVACGGFFFYPLMRANWLGQAQTVITLLFTVAFYAWMQGHEKLSGVAMGFTVMIKPQYGMLLVWTLIRRRYSAFLSGMICVALGVLASIAVFGWRQNLGYFSVLSFLSRHGESFAANQSMNGVLNRLLMNGSNLQWSVSDYPAYLPVVYYGTLFTAVVLLAVALFLPWRRVRKGGTTDLACFTLAVTMSSPVAWEHHYAILLPILVWMWFSDYGLRTDGRWGMVFAVLWVVIADYLSPADLTAPIPGLNVLQSTLYMAAWAILILLLRGNGQARSATAAQAAP